MVVTDGWALDGRRTLTARTQILRQATMGLDCVCPARIISLRIMVRLSLSKCEWSTPGDEARQKSGCLKNVGINSMSRSAVNESGVISRFAGKFVAANANAPETAAGVV